MDAIDDFRRGASRTIPHGHADSHTNHETISTRREDATWRGQPGRSQQHEAIHNSRTHRDHRDDPDGAGGRGHGYCRDGIGPGDHGAGNGYSRAGGNSGGMGSHQGGRERASHSQGADFGSTTAFPADRGAGGGRWAARPAGSRDQHSDYLNDSRNHQERQRHQPQQSSWHSSRRDEGRARGAERQGNGNGDGAAGIPGHVDSSWARRTERSMDGGDADRGGGGGRRIHGGVIRRNIGRNMGDNSSASPRAGDQSGGSSRDAFRGGDRSGGYPPRGRDGDGDGGGGAGAGRRERDRDRDRDRRAEEDSRGRFNRRNDARDLIRGNEDDARGTQTPENGEGRHGQDRDGRGYGGQRDQHSSSGGPGSERQQRRDYPRRDSRDRGIERDRWGGGNPSRDSRERAGGGRVADVSGDRDRVAERDRERRRNYTGDRNFRPEGYDLRESGRGERREEIRRHEPWRDSGPDHLQHYGRDRYKNAGGDGHRGPGRSWPGTREGAWNGRRDAEETRVDLRGRGYAGGGRAGGDREYHRGRGREVDRRRGTRLSRYDHAEDSTAFGICDGQWVGGGTGDPSSAPRTMPTGKPTSLSTGAGDADQKSSRGRSHAVSSTKHALMGDRGTSASGHPMAEGEAPRRPRWDKVGPTAAAPLPTSGPPVSSTENLVGRGGKKKLVWGGAAGSNVGGSKKRPLWATSGSSGSSVEAAGQGAGGNGDHGPAVLVHRGV